MPWDVEVNDFLARFLAASGPGPHHLTFKVPDLDATPSSRPVRFGIEPIGINVCRPRVDGGVPPPEVGHRRRRAAGPAAHRPWRSPAPDDYPTDLRLRADGSGPAAPAALVRSATWWPTWRRPVTSSADSWPAR